MNLLIVPISFWPTKSKKSRFFRSDSNVFKLLKLLIGKAGERNTTSAPGGNGDGNDVLFLAVNFITGPLLVAVGTGAGGIGGGSRGTIVGFCGTAFMTPGD